MKFYQALIAVSLVALASASEHQTSEFSNIAVLASNPKQEVDNATKEAQAKLD